jgi:hypothetical protein
MGRHYATIRTLPKRGKATPLTKKLLAQQMLDNAALNSRSNVIGLVIGG